MNELALRVLEHIHGHLAWLSTLALYHPALLAGRNGRRLRLVATTATSLVTLTGALGAILYPPYRALLKPAIFAASLSVGNAFERKEHLAMAVVVLAWAGLFACWAAGDDRAASRSFSRLALVAYRAAAVLATLTAALGVSVAVHRTF